MKHSFWSQLARKLTFDLMVRSERLAAAAAILRMSGLLLDFMISVQKVSEGKWMETERLQSSGTLSDSSVSTQWKNHINKHSLLTHIVHNIMKAWGALVCTVHGLFRTIVACSLPLLPAICLVSLCLLKVGKLLRYSTSLYVWKLQRWTGDGFVLQLQRRKRNRNKKQTDFNVMLYEMTLWSVFKPALLGSEWSNKGGFHCGDTGFWLILLCSVALGVNVLRLKVPN